MEIIEIGAVRMPVSSGPVTEEFDRFVRPVASPVLSDFCVELTSIRQSDVDAADYFWTVLPEFVSWMGEEPFTWCSWGMYDLNQISADCARHKMPLPPVFERHINLKAQFARMNGIRPCGVKAALELMKLPWDGVHHRAIDDVRNIARLAQHILPRLESTES